ncbi:hypothetical protein [Shewanella sp. UCD-KL12]|uniref:hypothetical protein n=1 Tax=Shewanella sp. UCD-KL12 TaxID=1917163 RepID=UPI000970DA13|nr:hypothetical protein [Shewanella sp. UCD-KL12]
MKFLLRSILLLGSLAWLIISAEQLLSLGVLQNPSIAMEHTTLLIQSLIAFIILRSTWGSNKKRDSF